MYWYRSRQRRLLLAGCATAPLLSASAWAADILVNSDATLRSAITSAASGDRIVFQNNITLSADLPLVQTNVTIAGNGNSLSGNGQFRGLFVGAFSGGTQVPVTVAIQDLAIASTRAQGGAGGAAGNGGGGGGGGLGGALFVANQATVTVSNVNLAGNAAVGGSGGNQTGPGGAGGGGMGGSGGAGGAVGIAEYGGGGGLGVGANGGTSGTANGQPGIATGASSGGNGSGASAGAGGLSGGAGGVGGINGAGGGGGGVNGGFGGNAEGGVGAFGGGGGGGDAGGIGGFGGGGGSGIGGGDGGFGGGGAGSAGVSVGFGGFGGGNGRRVSLGGGGGGGLGAGGAIFVQQGGNLTLAGPLTVDGNTVTAGSGVDNAFNGSAFGSGLFLQGNGTVTFAPGAGSTQTVTDAIADQTGSGGTGGNAGSYGLVKSGAGTLVLGGANAYSGGTTIAGGTLQLGNGGTAGSITGDVANDGVLAVNRSDSLTFGGAISGSGSLRQIGAGTTILAGNNTYGGGTFFDAGVLQVSTDNNLGDSSGGLFFNGGTLRFGAGFALGATRAVTLNAGSGTFDTNGFDGSVSGGISGTGALTKAGLGTLTLGSAASYTGVTNVNAGTFTALGANLFAPMSAHVVASGAVLDLGDFNQTIGSLAGAGQAILGGAALTAGGDNTSTVFSGMLTGTGGSLVKSGTGTLNLTGANTYTGTTTVNQGILLVNGSITSAVTVNGGGALGGSGTVGGASFTSGGMVSPGNSIGTLNVNGNVSFAAGSIYVVEINPQGQADRIVATGMATITGGTVQVQAENGVYVGGTRYVILTAMGGVVGTFTTLTTNLAFLNLTLAYDASNVFLDVTRTGATLPSFAAAAHTENQLSVGRAVDVLQLGATGDALTVTTAITSLSAPQARAAYDQIGGAAHGNLVMSSLTVRRMFGRALDDRLMQEQGGVAARASAAQPGSAQFALAGTAGQDLAPLLAAATTDGESRDTSTGWHTWVKGLGQFNSTSGNGNAQGYDLTIGGALLGADYKVLQGLRLGAAIGYAHGDFDGNNSSGSGGIDSYQGLVYGRYDHGKYFFADAQAGYAFNDYDLSRGISFSTINRNASSDSDGHDVSASLRIGAKLDSGGFNIVPSASLRYDRLYREGFTETGANSLDLTVAGKSFTALRSAIGARASYKLKLDESGIEIQPYAGAHWQHDFRNAAVPVEARFSGIGIDVHGTSAGRDAAVLQVGAAAVLDEQFSLFAGYDTELRTNQTDHAISAGMRYRW